jgi:co-chaperonin GroES (HSP10)
MTHPKAPTNNIIVRLDKTFQDTIITEGGVTLYTDVWHNPEWHTTVSGKVISIPGKIGYREVNGFEKFEYRGMSLQVKEGDEIIFSYMVINDCDLRDRNTPIHKNQFYHNGEYFWKVDYQFLLGFIRDGKLEAAQGYVFIEQVEDEITGVDLRDLVLGSKVNIEQYLAKFDGQQGLITASVGETKKAKGKGRVLSIGPNKTNEPKLSVKDGDLVRFTDRYACKYTVQNKEIIVLDQARILATENQ